MRGLPLLCLITSELISPPLKDKPSSFTSIQDARVSRLLLFLMTFLLVHHRLQNQLETTEIGDDKRYVSWMNIRQTRNRISAGLHLTMLHPQWNYEA